MGYIDIVFALLNFGVLVAFFTFIIKRYLVTYAADQVRMQHDEQRKLLLYRSSLKKRLKDLHHECSEQEVLCRELSEKIMQWKDVFMREQREQEAARERVWKSVLVRHEQQKVLCDQQAVQEHIVPQALADARLELYEKFHKDADGQRYIERVIKRLPS